MQAIRYRGPEDKAAVISWVGNSQLKVVEPPEESPQKFKECLLLYIETFPWDKGNTELAVLQYSLQNRGELCALGIDNILRPGSVLIRANFDSSDIAEYFVIEDKPFANLCSLATKAGESIEVAN